MNSEVEGTWHDINGKQSGIIVAWNEKASMLLSGSYKGHIAIKKCNDSCTGLKC